PLRAAGEAAANAAKAQNAERLAPYVSAKKLIQIPSRPRAGAHPLFTLWQAARDGHEQRPGKVRSGVVEDSRRVRGDNVVAGDGIDVDVVKADRNGGGDAQLGGRGEELFVDFFRKQADESLFV